MLDVERPKFDPTRLALARQLRGLRKVELADLVELTPAAITQFERGSTQPRRDVLVRLAFALRVPLTFFRPRSHRFGVTEQEFHFRRLRSSKKRDRQRVLARVAILVELVDAIGHHITLPPVDLPDGFALAGEHLNWRSTVEEAAGELRRRWGLGAGPISDMVRLLEAHGCIVTRLRVETEEIDAFSGWWGQRPFVVLSSDKEDAARSRFDAAHELGHLILHPDPDPTNRLYEVQAHAFASAFLLPQAVAKELPPVVDWGRFIELKERWRVSLQALLRRAEDVGRLSPSQYRRAMTQLSAKGWRVREPGDSGVPEEPVLLRTAISQIESEKGLSVRELATQLGLGIEDTYELFAGAPS
jgi:Zn-dependent peptidase ImmA (M78 family)/transcriptional regulator with XRE-family HTH domain